MISKVRKPAGTHSVLTLFLDSLSSSPWPSLVSLLTSRCLVAVIVCACDHRFASSASWRNRSFCAQHSRRWIVHPRNQRHQQRSVSVGRIVDCMCGRNCTHSVCSLACDVRCASFRLDSHVARLQVSTSPCISCAAQSSTAAASVADLCCACALSFSVCSNTARYVDQGENRKRHASTTEGKGCGNLRGGRSLTPLSFFFVLLLCLVVQVEASAKV